VLFRSLRRQDEVVVVTDHSAYDFGWIAKHARLIVDTRNAVPAQKGGAAVVRS
jgi:UDP-N-acetyl-D-glucosamine dehydrogenase